MPALDSMHRENLYQPLTAEEILSAIKTLKLGKRPGPDGLSVTYYKKFADLLSPLLERAYNSLLDGRSFRTKSITAISMIPKPHTDDSTWSNFGPISILNLDVKILAKILSIHLNPYIGSLIHKDQVWFIPSRPASNNIRHAALLTHAARTRHIPSCFVSLDIRKAFDTLSWPYLNFILRK